MKQTVTVEQVRKNLETGDFFLNCKIPLGYKTVFPILQIRNGSLCIMFPYLKYQTTGEVDKTLVFPVKYAVTLELPTEKAVCFEDFEYNEAFGDVDFDKPIGYFRHEAVREYSRAEYNNLHRELMREYDKVIHMLLVGGGYDSADERRMSELLRLLLEPSLLPIYRVLDRDFYNKYLAERKVDYGS